MGEKACSARPTGNPSADVGARVTGERGNRMKDFHRILNKVGSLFLKHLSCFSVFFLLYLFEKNYKVIMADFFGQNSSDSVSRIGKLSRPEFLAKDPENLLELEFSPKFKRGVVYLRSMNSNSVVAVVAFCRVRLFFPIGMGKIVENYRKFYPSYREISRLKLI
ncbi:hypothetical protein V0288_16850 [Pannus brasiliensis CCIBt3594]|uniref:Uncharacterized protein n=1 Tax=Pannus brasiliensis CCIBt3594 TaxID=1427578 RepID=A0AAW9QYA9_9CHRO